MTMTNLEWIAKKDIRAGNAIRCSDFGNWMAKNHFGEDVDYWFVKWLDMKHVEPILDDVERRYLSVVIKPFKNKIDYIIKNSCVSKDLEILSIVSKDDAWMDFFPFAKGSMYKGMETDREYTLEELKLYEDND